MALTRIQPPAIADVREPNFRNIVINGDMSLAQRSTSVSGITAFGYYTVDRMRLFGSYVGTWTQSQDTDVPTGQGFAKSLKMDCTTSSAVSAGSHLIINQRFEGQNLQYLKKGTSSAESLTLSFWVKSNKTGTYICELNDNDNTRQISKSYTISSADTWEKKTITYAGDTTGAFDNDNALSLYCNFWIGAGSNFTSGTLNTSWNSVTEANRAVGQVNLADSTSNEFFITGIQLEAGSVATDFEVVPFGQNLQRCQRYYQKIAEGTTQPIYLAMSYNATQANAFVLLPNTMRTTPSIDQTSGASYYRYVANATNTSFASFSVDYGSTQALAIKTASISGLTGGEAGWFQTTDASSYFAFDSEL